jgi:hypothetical protein
MNIAARPEVYNIDLALLLTFSTFGLVALFVAVRKLLLDRDGSNAKWASFGGTVAMGVSGYAGLAMGTFFGVFVAIACILSAAIYRAGVSLYGGRQNFLDSEDAIKQKNRQELEAFGAARIEANNKKREAVLKTIGGAGDE